MATFGSGGAGLPPRRQPEGEEDPFGQSLHDEKGRMRIAKKSQYNRMYYQKKQREKDLAAMHNKCTNPTQQINAKDPQIITLSDGEEEDSALRENRPEPADHRTSLPAYQNPPLYIYLRKEDLPTTPPEEFSTCYANHSEQFLLPSMKLVSPLEEVSDNPHLCSQFNPDASSLNCLSNSKILIKPPVTLIHDINAPPTTSYSSNVYVQSIKEKETLIWLDPSQSEEAASTSFATPMPFVVVPGGSSVAVPEDAPAIQHEDNYVELPLTNSEVEARMKVLAPKLAALIKRRNDSELELFKMERRDCVTRRQYQRIVDTLTREIANKQQEYEDLTTYLQRYIK